MAFWRVDAVYLAYLAYLAYLWTTLAEVQPDRRLVFFYLWPCERNRLFLDPQISQTSQMNGVKAAPVEFARHWMKALRAMG